MDQLFVKSPIRISGIWNEVGELFYFGQWVKPIIMHKPCCHQNNPLEGNAKVAIFDSTSPHGNHLWKTMMCEMPTVNDTSHVLIIIDSDIEIITFNSDGECNKLGEEPVG